MIAALVLALSASSPVPMAGAPIPAWASRIGLNSDPTKIDRRARLPVARRADPPTATLATFLPTSETCLLLGTPLGRLLPDIVRVAWPIEPPPLSRQDDFPRRITYVRTNKTRRAQRTAMTCDDQERVVGMSDLYEDTAAVVRADFKRFHSLARKEFGDPTDIEVDPRDHALRLNWRWSSGALLHLYAQANDNPKSAVFIVRLER